MKLRSHVDWPSFIFRQYNPEGEMNVAVTTSVIFDIVNGQTLVQSQDQRDIQLKDEYTGDIPKSHLVRQADFVPYKPSTDITTIAQAWSPSNLPEKSWLVGIRVKRNEDIINKELRVHGPRFWERDQNNKWIISEAEPAKSVPLDYYYAFGGDILDEEINGDMPPACNIFNPVGPGVLKNLSYKERDHFPAPQIEEKDNPIESPDGDYVPQGFAAIAPVWRFREQFAGTYDEKWVDIQHPFLPQDFDYRFYNCAHPDLTVSPFLEGRERFQLANLHPIYKQMSFELPNVKLGAVASYNDGASARLEMALDGVHFELLQTVPKVRLTWRVGFPWGVGIRFVDVGKIKQKNEQTVG